MPVEASENAEEKKTITKRSKKVQPIGKQYKFSNAEQATYGMISAKFMLADEKAKSAVEIRQTAQMLQDQWLQNMLAQRSIDTKRKINVDVENCVITVMPAGEK